MKPRRPYIIDLNQQSDWLSAYRCAKLDHLLDVDLGPGVAGCRCGRFVEVVANISAARATPGAASQSDEHEGD